MPKSQHIAPAGTPELSRRERQIVDALYRLGRATAAEVQAAIPRPPSYSAVRSALALLEARGVVRHEEEGRRYVYSPATPAPQARRGALQHLLSTFFGGSRIEALGALMEDPRGLSDEELAELERLLARARKGRRR
jgi:BlaI family transcriptional regulator, penicillinase repressor